jgi:hypothetical protein
MIAAHGPAVVRWQRWLITLSHTVATRTGSGIAAIGSRSASLAMIVASNGWNETMDSKSCKKLWQEVLMTSIKDALEGAPSWAADRVEATHIARRYFTVANIDCNTVCELAGVDPEAVRDRMRRLIANAPSPEDLFGIPHSERRLTSEKPAQQPKRQARFLTHNGEQRRMVDWARHYGISYRVVHSRIRKGWSVDRALTEPVAQMGKKVGVVSNFVRTKGTGGGSAAQDSMNIDFSNEQVPQCL